MRRWPSIVLSFISIALGLALGYAARVWTAHSSTTAVVGSIGTNAKTDSKTEIIAKSDRAAEDRFTAIVSALRESETLASRANLYRVLSKVPASEIPGLIDRAQKLPLKVRDDLSTALFEHWLGLDRTAAEQWIRQEGRARGCYTAWARVSPQQALDYAFASPWTVSFWGTIPAALDALVGKDPQARLDRLRNYPKGIEGNRILESEFSSWATSDPASALSWTATVQDEKLRNKLVETSLTELAKQDPKTAVLRAKEMIPRLTATITGNDFISNFTRGLAEKDPALACEFAENLPPEMQTAPMIAAGSAWAKTDPVAALEWAYAKGIDLSQNFTAGSFYMQSNIVGEAMKAQPKQTVDWLLALPEGNDRDGWLQRVLFLDGVKKDIDLTRKIFDSMSEDRHLRLAHGFGRQIAESGPLPDLQTWASWIPDEAVRARAIGGAFAETFGNAPARVESMVKELPGGPIRDQALAALSQIQSFSTPTDAAARALEIRDQTVRYDALDRLMISWMDRDRKTAEDWLNSQSDLPHEWVAEWLAIKPFQ